MSPDQKYTISLVQTNDEIGNNIILPLAIGMLWQTTQIDPINSTKWKLENIVYSKSVNIDFTAQQLATSDIVAMSTYIWNIDFQMELAQRIKFYNPSCFILVGGPEISPNATIWTDYPGLIDLAIEGEGDISFNKFLQQWPNYDVTTIPGAWTQDYYAEQAPRVTDLTPFPSPYLAGFYDEIISKELANGRYIEVVLQTNRGCPYHCTFCEEGKEYKNKMFFYDEDRIRAEINWCGRKGVEYLAIADANWGISERDVELMRYMCETKIKYDYPRIVDAVWAKNAPERVLEMARIDKQMGTNLIRGITIALQSTDPTTLRAVKRFNLVDHKQVEFVKKLIEMEVPTYVEIIWPLPLENLKSFLHGIDQIVNAKTATWLAVYPLKIHKSSDLYDDYSADYTYPIIDPTQNIDDDFHPAANTIPYASKWADHNDIVEGHVIYGWVAVMYYFGYAYPIVIWLQKEYGYTVTEIVIKFRDFLKTKKCETQTTDLIYYQFWSSWLQKRTGPELSIFSKDQTKFWYPYTHLSSRIQRDNTDFYECLGEFLHSESVDPVVAESLVYLSRHGIVHYDQKYPYTLRDGSLIEIKHPRPNFLNPAEFGQFYYWFKRKQAYSKISLANSPEYQSLFG